MPRCRNCWTRRKPICRGLKSSALSSVPCPLPPALIMRPGPASPEAGKGGSCVGQLANPQRTKTFELLCVGYRQLWRQDAVPGCISGAFADEIFDCRNEGVGCD